MKASLMILALLFLELCISGISPTLKMNTNKPEPIAVEDMEHKQQVQILKHLSSGNHKSENVDALVISDSLPKPASGIKITTADDKVVELTNDHYVHTGDTCCGFESIRTAHKVFQLSQSGSVNLWKYENGAATKVTVKSAEEIQMSEAADVLPFDSLEKTQMADGKCIWDRAASLVVNGIIISPAYDMFAGNSVQVETKRKLQLYHLYADDNEQGLADFDFKKVDAKDMSSIFEEGQKMLNSVYDCLFAGACTFDSLDDDEKKAVTHEILDYLTISNGNCNPLKGTLLSTTIAQHVIKKKSVEVTLASGYGNDFKWETALPLLPIAIVIAYFTCRNCKAEQSSTPLLP